MAEEDKKNFNGIADFLKPIPRFNFFCGTVRKNEARTRHVNFLEEGVLTKAVFDLIQPIGESVRLDGHRRAMLFSVKRTRGDDKHILKVLKISVSGFSVSLNALNANIPQFVPSVTTPGRHVASAANLHALDTFSLYERVLTTNLHGVYIKKLHKDILSFLGQRPFRRYVKHFTDTYRWQNSLAPMNVVLFTVDGFAARAIMEDVSVARFCTNLKLKESNRKQFLSLQTRMIRCIAKLRGMTGAEVATVFRCAEDNLHSHCALPLSPDAAVSNSQVLVDADEVYTFCLMAEVNRDGTTRLSNRIKAPCSICAWHFFHDFCGVAQFDGTRNVRYVAVEGGKLKDDYIQYDVAQIVFAH